MLNYDLLDEQLQNRQPFEKRAVYARHFSKSADVSTEDRLVEMMQPIDPEYTEKSFAEGESVKSGLSAYLSARFSASYEFQGSVTSNTHIKLHSDIDLLVLHGLFVIRDGYVPPGNTFGGSVLGELVSLREESSTALRRRFTTATVDSSPGKAIALSGYPLERKVDVVMASWWDTLDYQRSQDKPDRGIHILNSRVPETMRNKPFLHNQRLDRKDGRTGGLRKAIRLLKSLKYSSQPQLKISSYDIASIVYNMTDTALSVPEDAYTTLAKNVYGELKRFADNSTVRDSMMVPNETRKVFAPDGTSLEALKELQSSLGDLLAALSSQISFSNKRAAHLNVPITRPWRETLPASVRKYSF